VVLPSLLKARSFTRGASTQVRRTGLYLVSCVGEIPELISRPRCLLPSRPPESYHLPMSGAPNRMIDTNRSTGPQVHSAVNRVSSPNEVSLQRYQACYLSAFPNPGHDCIGNQDSGAEAKSSCTRCRDNGGGRCTSVRGAHGKAGILRRRWPSYLTYTIHLRRGPSPVPTPSHASRQRLVFHVLGINPFTFTRSRECRCWTCSCIFRIQVQLNPEPMHMRASLTGVR
jgi:hypothetical protein